MRVAPEQGFLTWGASTPKGAEINFRGCWGRSHAAVKGKRNVMYCTCLYFILIVTRCEQW